MILGEPGAVHWAWGGATRSPKPQWASAAAVGLGAVGGAWGVGPPEPKWAAAAAAVGPGAVRRDSQ